MERSCTLSNLVEEALLKALSATVRSPSPDPTRLLTFGGRGVLPGVDLESTAELLDRMEGR